MPDLDVSNLLSVPQALRRLDAVAVQPRVIRLPLSQAQGLRLARGLAADRDYPPFDKSLMDGYAIRRADAASVPIDLRVVGEIAAGQFPQQSLDPGQVVAIMTGAPIPPGADGVVPVEDVEKTAADSVRILSTDNPARHVAPRGSDCPAGQVVLKAGSTLGPVQLSVAATIGAAEVDVFAPPRVAVLATGNELVPIDQTPGPAQIRNSNSPMIVAVLARMGCEVTDLGAAPDRPDVLREALARGLEYDVLFVSGGMSMGQHDHVPRLLQELGVQLQITKLRMKPGKPFVFGIKEGSGLGVQGSKEGSGFRVQGSGGEAVVSASLNPEPRTPNPLSSSLNPEPRTLNPPMSYVFGLPGNPVSAYVCTVRLASRLISRLAGGPVEERWVSGKLDSGLPVNGPREFYQPAVRTITQGRDSSHSELASIRPLNWKGSADLFTLAQSNVLLVRPENDPPLPKGTIVRVLEI